MRRIHPAMFVVAALISAYLFGSMPLRHTPQLGMLLRVGCSPGTCKKGSGRITGNAETTLTSELATG
jgi:hypothetical protein